MQTSVPPWRRASWLASIHGLTVASARPGPAPAPEREAHPQRAPTVRRLSCAGSTWRRAVHGALAGLLAASVSLAMAQEGTRAASQARGEPIRLGLVEGLSGAFSNAGEAVFRNLVWAVERVNARGGVRLPAEAGGARPLELVRFDNKGATEEALAMLRAAIDQRIAYVFQGNSSAVAAAMIDAIDKHNEREPQRRVLFLNYAAVDPILTNERCSFWHFRFDAHADMRMDALTEAMRQDRELQRVYLIGQDYSFGQHVLRSARAMLADKRPDIEIVGQELHPMGRVRDFLPYAAKIRASGAQAVVTGNWGNDLTLLVRAVREIGLDVRFYTFYGNALGVPAAVGEAGAGRVVAVAEWHPNLGGEASDAFYRAFRERFPRPADDYLHLRMQLMVDMLVQAMEQAGSTEPVAVAQALSRLQLAQPGWGGFHPALMREQDHQLLQPLVVSVMDRQGSPGVQFDNEGSGYGFRTLLTVPVSQQQPAHQCDMRRPEGAAR